MRWSFPEQEADMGSYERGVLQSLSRTDKWSLGGDGPVLWAPGAPMWIDKPGFWDPGQYYHHEIGPLFGIQLLNRGGEPLQLQLTKRRWTPAYILQEYETPDRIKILERKTILPSGSAVSELRIEADYQVEIVVATWSVQPYPADIKISGDENRISLVKQLQAPVGSQDHIWLTLAAGPQESVTYAIPSQTSVPGPLWRLSALWEAMGVRLEDPIRGVRGDFVHVAIVTELSLESQVPARIMSCMAMGTDRESTFEEAGRWTSGSTRPIEESVDRWETHLESLPRFRCSDEFVERAYWHRWAGLRLAMLNPGVGMLPRPAICEGPGYFRRVITYSLQAHLRELRWMHSPKMARDTLLNVFDAQESGGRIGGIIDVNGVQDGSFYHVDWAGSILDLLAVHPDVELLETAYGVLSRYARWLQADRDPEREGLYRVMNHFETGQEYSSRYQAFAEQSDRDCWGSRFQLYGVDATVYAYLLNHGLSIMAGALGRLHEVSSWQTAAMGIRDAVLARMWDRRAGMFFDVDPGTDARTGVKAGTCFYPFFTDMVGQEHMPALEDHLLNEAEFWTQYPFPSVSMDDARFSPLGLWKGTHMNCPWNGRSWPMLNSHLVEALANSALEHRQSLLPAAGEAIMRTIRLLFHQGDPSRPNSFEHYNPLTGKPSLYRGIDDYQHSWILDHIIKYIAGLQPGFDGKLRIRPVPTGIRNVEVTGVRIGGRSMDIELSDGMVTKLSVDGEPSTLNPDGSIRDWCPETL